MGYLPDAEFSKTMVVFSIGFYFALTSVLSYLVRLTILPSFSCSTKFYTSESIRIDTEQKKALGEKQCFKAGALIKASLGIFILGIFITLRMCCLPDAYITTGPNGLSSPSSLAEKILMTFCQYINQYLPCITKNSHALSVINYLKTARHYLV